MPRPLTEFDIQRAYIMWACGVPGKIEPALLPGVICWHVPNGGARSAVEGKRFKESGVLPGIPDIHHLWGRLLCLEFKKPGGRLSPAQLDLHPRLVAAGALVATVDSLEGAKSQARAWQIVRDGC